jgi:hypothetical protein
MATTRPRRSLLWLIGSVAARPSLPRASGSLPIRSTRPVPPLSRIGLAGRGIQIQPDPPPSPSPGERRKLVRDALRMSLWRATGSTGGWLVPHAVARKRLQCGL